MPCASSSQSLPYLFYFLQYIVTVMKSDIKVSMWFREVLQHFTPEKKKILVLDWSTNVCNALVYFGFVRVGGINMPKKNCHAATDRQSTRTTLIRRFLVSRDYSHRQPRMCSITFQTAANANWFGNICAAILVLLLELLSSEIRRWKKWPDPLTTQIRSSPTVWWCLSLTSMADGVHRFTCVTCVSASAAAKCLFALTFSASADNAVRLCNATCILFPFN